MKAKKLIVVAVLLTASVLGALFAQSASKNKQNKSASADFASGKKILVAYFSVSGNTKEMAQYVADSTGADLFEIKPTVPYTMADLNWRDSACRALREQRDENSRPEISKSLKDLASYDVVFVAYPIWAGMAPRIMYTFLENYDFAGKVIVPFCTSGTSGLGTSAEKLSECAPKAKWQPGTRFAAGTFIDVVADWAKAAIK